jgi:ketosteroid isomerase-like protein
MKFAEFFLGVVCLAILFLPTCAPAPVPESTTEEVLDTQAEAEQAEHFLQQALEMLNSADMELLKSMIAEDAVYVPPNRALLVGEDAILDFYQSNFDRYTYKLSRVADEMVVCGDWAFARHTFTGTMEPKEEGDTIDLDNTGIVILQCQPDGSWKVARAIWNSNIPSAQ